MARIRSASFLRPVGAIEKGPWELLTRDGWQVLGEHVPDWDYAAAVTLRTVVEVDQKLVREQCRLNVSDVALGAAAAWHSTGTGRRGALPPVILDDSDGAAVIVGRLNSAELGGNLHLTTRVILAAVDPETPSHALAPSRVGNILWQTDDKVRLEGTDALFPVELAAFSNVGLPSGAAWQLELDTTNPGASALGRIRLFINTENRGAYEAALAPESTAEAALTTSVMRVDILRQMIERALDCDDIETLDDFGPGTVGRVLATAVWTAFPDHTLEGVRALRQGDRRDFETRIQHAGRLLS